MNVDVTGINRIISNDVLGIVSGYDAAIEFQQTEKKDQAANVQNAQHKVLEGVSRFKKYDRIELSCVQKIIRIVLIFLSLGIWRCVQNARFKKAIYLGTAAGIRTAISAIRWGAAGYLTPEDLGTLTTQNKMHSLEFLIAQEPKTTRCASHYNPSYCCENYSSQVSLQYLKKLCPIIPYGSWVAQKECSEIDIKILDIFLKYHLNNGCTNIPDLNRYSICGEDTRPGSCEAKFQNRLLLSTTHSRKWNYCSAGGWSWDDTHQQIYALFLKHGLCVNELYRFDVRHFSNSPLSVEFWLNAGVDPNISATDGHQIRTLLERTINSNADPTKYCRLLIERGLNYPGFANTALELACRRHHNGIINLFIELNGTVNTQALNDSVSYSCNSYSLDEKTLGSLLDLAEKQQVNIQYVHMIHSAVQYCKKEVVKLLLIRASKIGIIPSTESLERALCFARNDNDIAGLLLAFGAPLSERSFTLAVEKKNWTMLEALVKVAKEQGNTWTATLQTIQKSIAEKCQSAKQLLQVNALINS